MKIEWLGHDGMRIRAQEVVIYVDPYQIEGGEKADILLVTHGHFDHCSAEDIKKILKKDTVILSSVGCKTPAQAEEMRPGDVKEIKGVRIEAVPAYNVNKRFHPKSDEGLGYVITVEGQRIYHAGDTDLIDEMSGIDCDIALLPVSGTYVMTAKEAIDAAKRIRPKLAIPMHYGAGVVGTVEDAEAFAAGLEGTGIEVEIKTETP